MNEKKALLQTSPNRILALKDSIVIATIAIMGIDEGFDMIPPLSREAKDVKDWENFLDCVRTFYKDDPKVETNSHSIGFNAGEYPELPFEGHKFLRFSSKISGRIASDTGVENYINMVTSMAKIIFGPRVQHWSEAFDQYGHYGWEEIHRVRETWDKVCEFAKCRETALNFNCIAR